MDRREALKKLGAGSAVVVGASVVVSSPAFAYAAPTVTGLPATFTLTKANASTATIAVSGFPAGSCPISSTNLNDVPTQGAPALAWTAGTNTGTTALVTNSGNWAAGSLVTVSVTVAYTCTYTTGSSTRNYRWTRVFRSSAQSGSGDFTVESTSGPTVVP